MTNPEYSQYGPHMDLYPLRPLQNNPLGALKKNRGPQEISSNYIKAQDCLIRPPYDPVSPLTATLKEPFKDAIEGPILGQHRNSFGFPGSSSQTFGLKARATLLAERFHRIFPPIAAVLKVASTDVLKD